MFIFQYFSFYKQLKFYAELQWAKKQGPDYSHS